MERKERIFSYISSEEYVPLKFDELAAVLDVPEADKPELQRILTELLNEHKIRMSKKKRYFPADDNTVIGKLSCSAKGYFGFVSCDDGDVYVSGDMLGNAFDGDTVLVTLLSREKDGKRREGYVSDILERGSNDIVGVICEEKEGVFRLRPDNRRIYAKVRIRPEDMNGAVINSRAVCAVTEYTSDGKPFGKITAVLGDESSLKSYVEGVIAENGIRCEFSPEAISEADSIPSHVENIGNRADLRDMMIFTIDGDDAKDFDDAVSLSITDDGNHLLGVHIADVTHYVRQGSPLDLEAFDRATSVYLADRVIPMLPERLSNGICSLNPNEDRFTLSLFAKIDRNGNVADFELKKAVICSKYRLTYNNVNAILEDGDDALIAEYSEIVPTLREMASLAETLRNKRTKRGAINFDFPESFAVVDEDGNPTDIVKEERGTSHRLIEEFMLLANETVAEYAARLEIPFVYRVHEPPDSEKIAAFNKFLRGFNLTLKGKVDAQNPVHPKSLQTVLDSVKDTPEERMIASNMLHSLMKAEYSTENLGHFGLAARYYCHFTSPIRRYPDLTVHRIIKNLLDGEIIDDRTDEAAKHSSERETAAERAERSVDDLMKTAYMSRFIGEVFEGTVANTTNFGMFVELENTVEGLVRLENMTGDYYEYNETAGTLTGKRTGSVYRIGDTVSVVLAKTDLSLRQIDFVLEKDRKLLRKFSAARKPVRPKKIKGRKYIKRKKKRNG